MQNLKRVLSDGPTLQAIHKDFTLTFKNLGCDEVSASALAADVNCIIMNSATIEDAENEVRKLFTETMVATPSGMLPLYKKVEIGLVLRVHVIYEQVIPYLKDISTVLDYGCGSGMLAEMIKRNLRLNVTGLDIRNFLAEGVSIPFHFLSRGDTAESIGMYDCVVATNVLHHDEDNEYLIQDLTKVATRRLVIIETVSETDTPEVAEKDWGRMFANDVLWNRFFNSADIPVPGTYEIPSNWIKRFERYGWKCIHSEDLGIDQPTIQDRHHLLVFEK